MDETLKRLIYVLAKCEDVCSLDDFHGLNEKAGINNAIEFLVKEGLMVDTENSEGEAGSRFMLTEKGYALLASVKKIKFINY